MTCHVKIKLSEHGKGTVEVDGIEISVYAAHVHLAVGEPNRVHLELYADKIDIDGQFEVTKMGDESRSYRQA